MKSSEKCKAAGLKSLSELVRITGRAERTLIDWANHSPEFFDIVVLGASLIKQRVK